MRIRLETDAVYLILNQIKDGLYNPIKSRVHSYEVTAISNILERQEILALLEKFSQNDSVNSESVRKRAEYLYEQGFGLADAAHLAYAESTADVFITCDNKLLKKWVF